MAYEMCWLTMGGGGGSANIQVVQSQRLLNINSGMTRISLTMSTTAGNLLVAYVREGSDNTATLSVTDNLTQTWTQVGGPTGYNTFTGQTNNRSAMFYKENSGAVSTVHFDISPGVTRPAIVCYEISGIATSGAIDGTPIFTLGGAGQSTTLTSGGITTTVADTILLHGVDVSADQGTDPAPTFSPGSGWLAAGTGESATNRNCIYYKIVSATQSGTTATTDWTVNALSSSILAAFKAA
jgi:hypothetical protein